MNKKANVIIGIGAALMAMVAIFVMFSTGFGPDKDLESVRGSVFTIMFGSSTMGYHAVPGLIVGFVLLIVGFLSALVSCFLPGKSAMFGFGITLVLFAVGATLFAFAPAMYKAANSDLISTAITEDITLGVGLILTMVFGYLGAALSLFGAYSNLKA